jgi:dipeptidyl aminopeptidase/acylaminoacyl peptidase
MKSKEFLLTHRKIKGWLYYPENNRLNPVVIICHGIPGGLPVQGDSGYQPLACTLAQNGYLTAIFNFSGCGESSGNIDLNRWYEDINAVYEFITELSRADNNSIHIIGFSAGGAIAAKFAAYEKKKLSSMMLMATPSDFISIIPGDAALVASHFKSIGLIRDDGFPADLKAWHNGFISLKPENLIRWFPRDLPVCIVQGQNDTVVSPDHAERLYAAAKEPKRLIMLKDAPHQLRKDERIPELILDWLNENRI